MENMAELNKNFEEVLPNNFVLVKEPKQGCSTRQWEWSIGHKTLYCDIHTSRLDAPGKEPGMRIWVFNYNITVWFYKTFGENHTLENISKSIITMLNEKYGIKDVEIREDEESVMPEDDSSVNGEKREDERYVIPEGVKEIAPYEFSKWKHLKEVVFPDDLKVIGESAFKGIPLERLHFGNGLERIDKTAFEGCQNLEEITMPDNNFLLIDSRAFAGCSNLKNIYFGKGLVEWSWETFSSCSPQLTFHINKLSYLNNIDNIEEYIRGKCKYKIVITDPETGTSNKVFPSISTVKAQELFEINNGVLSLKKDSEIEIDGILEIPEEVDGEKVTAIADEAFKGCHKMNTVVIPDSVVQLGYGAFANCLCLTKVKLPEGLKEISRCAFDNCRSLKTIEFPKQLEVIDGYAFFECKQLTEVKMPNTVKILGIAAFSACSNLKSVSISHGIQVIPPSAFCSSSIESITIPESVSVIKHYAFHSKRLRSITLPESLMEIDEKALPHGVKIVIISKGTRAKFEKLLPNYKCCLYERNENERE